MPQITVNEIDQSVVTRVVSDDKVKVLIPAILSFGPGYDREQSSVMTFTDVSAFNRGCGYTPAEFNPITNDYSRIYARELMKRGAAVSVVRVNNSGEVASFNIDGINNDRSNPSKNTVAPSVLRGIPTNDCEKKEDIAVSLSVDGDTKKATLDGGGVIIPGTVKIIVNGDEYTDSFIPPVFSYDSSTDSNSYTGSIVRRVSTGTEYELFGKIDYYTGEITKIPNTFTEATSTFRQYSGSNSWKYTFCPQISGISAKYSGSFGNDLFISIAQINTTRLTESYQYANISVYYIDRNINYSYNEATGKSEIVSETVNNVTMLETKRVSTNPNDPNYFEDVEFDFIKITATPTAREELGLVWSNIEGRPESEEQYSGFPVIPFRYNVYANGLSAYNFDAGMTKNFGTDFNYSTEMVEKLKSGFKGFDVSASQSSDNHWTQDDVNNYLNEVYTTTPDRICIRDVIFSNIASLYENFTDPYIYDFDFITSGGFVYELYKVVNSTKNNYTKITGNTSGSGASQTNVLTSPVTDIQTVSGSVKIENNTYVKFTVESSDTTFVIKGAKENETTFATTIATITKANGTVTGITANEADCTLEINYSYEYKVGNTSVKQADRVYPVSTDYTSITPIHASMLNLVESRQDCIALFDVPSYYDRREGLIEYSRMLDTSYGTMHFPWCWVSDPDVASNMLLMAPSYIFLYTFLSNLDNNVDSQKWFPPAGVKRATARVVKKPDFEIGSTLLNIWQNDNTARVNPIMKLKQYGYVIYGQYTCLPAIDMYTHSALESLNVRLIANVVKKKIFDVCLNLAFEPNTSTLWLKFFSQMDEFLRYMQYNEGLYAYKIVMDESTVTTDDINHLRCPGKVYIAPTRTAEFFDIDFIITEAGAQFNN